MRSVRHALTILAVEDLARAAAFYDAAFGWPRAVDVPVYVEYQLADGMRLGLYDRRGFGRNTGALPHPTPPGALAPTELYFYAEDVAAMDAALVAAGATSLGPRAARDWGDEAAYFRDPDGNVLVIARPLPQL